MAPNGLPNGHPNPPKIRKNRKGKGSRLGMDFGCPSELPWKSQKWSKCNKYCIQLTVGRYLKNGILDAFWPCFRTPFGLPRRILGDPESIKKMIKNRYPKISKITPKRVSQKVTLSPFFRLFWKACWPLGSRGSPTGPRETTISQN